MFRIGISNHLVTVPRLTLRIPGILTRTLTDPHALRVHRFNQMAVSNAPKGPIRAVILAAAILAVVAAVFLLPTKGYVVGALTWFETLGPWGPVLLSLFYVVATVLFLPGSIITLGAGVLFGVWKGFLAAWAGANLGAFAAFLLGRTLARDWVDRKASAHPRFSAIESAVSREGFKIVLLLRLSPVFPFNLLNYALGLTRVPFWKYAVATLIGMVPGGLMYVYIGSAAGSLAAVAAGDVEGGFAAQLLKWIGLGVTVVVTLFVTRLARKSLKAMEGGPEAELELNASGQAIGEGQDS
jgi:uncharacterized membrane protein YdjX (TVP38/TMEM64 family)